MQHNQRTSVLPILILGIFFFIFGFVTWLNGTLIPYLKIACELNNMQAMLVTFAFYISYFVMALPSSAVLRKTGFKKGMMLGLLIMALGALLFVPAAMTRTYGIFLLGLFIIGTGLSVLQTASNPYVTILGPMESAAKRISIMGICNKVAGFLAPLILGAIILSDADILVEQLLSLSPQEKAVRLDELASRVILPYIVMAVVLTGLALLVRWSPLPEIDQAEEQIPDVETDGGSVIGFPQLVLGAIALFLYVGVEVIAVDTIGTYAQSQQIPLSEAKNLPSLPLAAMVLGYIIGIFTIPHLLTQAKALLISAILGILFTTLVLLPVGTTCRASAILGILFTTLVSLSSGYTSVIFLSLLGLANALVWPAIWPLALEGLGKYTKTASAMLIMAIAGGALLPLLYGKLADMTAVGPRQAYWIMVPCYLFILFYALRGYKLRRW